VSAEATRARWCVAAVFFANGAAMGSWPVHLPTIKRALGLSDAQLGLCLLTPAAGAIAAMLLAGAAAAKVGTRGVMLVAGVALGATVVLPVSAAQAGEVWALVAGLLVLGAANGALDVSMNGHAVAVEERVGQPIMSGLHGMYSLGGFVGAGAAWVALKLGATPGWHVAGAAVVTASGVVAAWRGLLPRSADARAEGAKFAVPSKGVVLLGVLCFAALVSEGAMGDWTAVYLRQTLGAGEATGALGFAGFSVAMAAGRFGGDAMAVRFGRVPLVRVSALVGAVGMGAGLLVPHPTGAIAGFVLLGLGLSNAVPVLFSAAGKTPGVPAGVGIAAVATLGYAGLLAGPGLIGLIAEVATLRVALLVVAGCALVLGVFAGAARR
jgi:MFS family permease